MLTRKEMEILEVLEIEATQHAVEIVTVEVVGAKKSPTIRIYIDTDEGVSFDELSSAQSWINDIIDRLDPFPGAYMLEVSSPGIDRPLRTREHFIQFCDEIAVVTTTTPIDGRAKFTGVLKGLNEDKVVLDIEGATITIPFDDIKRARLKGTVQFGS